LPSFVRRFLLGLHHLLPFVCVRRERNRQTDREREREKERDRETEREKKSMYFMNGIDIHQVLDIRIRVCHSQVREHSSALHLPQVDPNERVCFRIQRGRWYVLRVWDFAWAPLFLPLRVLDPFRTPCPLVFWVSDHRMFPLSVQFFVPIFWPFSVFEKKRERERE